MFGLLITDYTQVAEKVRKLGQDSSVLAAKTVLELQDLKYTLSIEKTAEKVKENAKKLKTFEEFDDILQMYKDIKAKKALYHIPISPQLLWHIYITPNFFIYSF